MELKAFKTNELVRELAAREGVKKITAEPYEENAITVEGPAIILIITD